MSLTTTSHSYTGAKDYTFGSNRGNNTAAAELTTEYTVSFQGKDYPLSISGSVSGSVERTSSTSTHNTYTFTASLLADGVTVATDSGQAVETVEKDEPEEEDKVTTSIEKTGVSNGELHYKVIITHTVNTDQNSEQEYSIPIDASISASAVNDWTITEGEPSGMSLTTSYHSYTGAQTYTFGTNPNRGNNTASAELTTDYTVTHNGKTVTLSVAGTVTASVSKNGNTYTFTANIQADGVTIDSDSDTAVETINSKPVDPDPEPEPEPDYIAVTNVVSTVAIGSSIGEYKVVFVAHYADGTSVSSTGATAQGTYNSMEGNSLVNLSEVGNTYHWGSTTITKHNFTYSGYPDPFLNCSYEQHSDGSVTATNELGNSYIFSARK